MRSIHHLILDSLSLRAMSAEGIFLSVGAGETMTLKSFKIRVSELVASNEVEKWVVHKGYQVYRLNKEGAAYKFYKAKEEERFKSSVKVEIELLVGDVLVLALRGLNGIGGYLKRRANSIKAAIRKY